MSQMKIYEVNEKCIFYHLAEVPIQLKYYRIHLCNE